jgi:predicted lipoprotein with Yx(FWY)xxD motif
VIKIRTLHVFTLLAAVAALALAGCGGDDNNDSGANSGGGGGSSGGGAETNAETQPSSGGAAEVTLANVPKVGMVLVNPEGFTLYEFEKDKGSTSTCNGGCAEAWPPLTTEGAPEPGNGATASKLGTSKRSDGSEQVTYAGRPLYTFTGDSEPGEANGNGLDNFGAKWFALDAEGEKASP